MHEAPKPFDGAVMRLFLAWFVLISVWSYARADVPPPYEVYGIGAELEESEPFPKLSRFKKNGPADEAALKDGDQVIAIDGRYSKSNQVPFYFYARGLQGPKDSVVELIILRNGREVRLVKLRRTVKR